MELPKVEGTQVRGKIYHLNLRIKPEIQALYDGKTHLRGSLRTSDPDEARREVERRRAELAEKEQEHARQVEVEDMVSQLSPEQRAAYDAAGGLEGLLAEFERKNESADRAAPGPVEAEDDAFEIEGTTWQDPPGPNPIAADASDVLGADPAPAAMDLQPAPPSPPPFLTPSRKEAPAADTTSAAQDNWPFDDVAEPGLSEDYDYEDRPEFTLGDLFDGYAPTLEPAAADNMRQIVRLFTEFHGELEYRELTLGHLDAFAEAARSLPADMMAKLTDGTLVRDLPYSEMIAWTVAAEARQISETTRFQYVALLKELMAFGVPHYRRGDPWSDYRLQIVRRETTEAAAPVTPSRRKPERSFTVMDAMTRLLGMAILILIVLVLYMLWEARTT